MSPNPRKKPATKRERTARTARSATKARPPHSRVVWSFFSGAGGLDLGLEQAGIGPSMTLELDPRCCETLRLNRPDLLVLEKDVRDVTVRSLRQATGHRGEVYLMVGGPPCQSFSPGGNREGLSDPRGNLIYEYFALVRSVRPQFFIFENVANIVTAALQHRPIDQRPGKHWNLGIYESKPRLATADAAAMLPEELSGSAIRLMLEELKPLRYALNFGVVDAADYGAAQHRLRFVMIGARDGAPVALPAPTHGAPGSGQRPWSTLGDAILNLADDPGPHYKYTDSYREIFSNVPRGGNWRDLPRRLQVRGMGASLDSGGGKTGFFRRLSWSQPAPTITGKPNRKGAALCHPDGLRPLSVKECARIQGFPDQWGFAGPLQDQYQQIGNAVPVHLGAALGRALRNPVRLRETPPGDLLLARAVSRLRASARNKRSRMPDQLTLEPLEIPST